MRVLFDPYIFNWQIVGGVSRYYVELISALQDEGVETILPVYLSNNIYINKNCKFPFVHRFFPTYGGHYRDKIIGRVNWELTKYYYRKENFDIYHPTFFDLSFLKEKFAPKKPFVLTVHDMANEHFGFNDRNIIQVKKELIFRADRIIAISEHTKREILNYYSISPDKITVVYHGVNPISERKKPKDVNENITYILYVGGRSGYKNWIRFIEAFSLAVMKYSEIHLICVGEKFTKEEIQLLDRKCLLNRVINCLVSDAELSWLYEHAICFVFPSLYEGFGLPILESLLHGTPVLCSNSHSFPEIALDNAIYFDPQNIYSISDAILEVIENNSLRVKLIKGGFERVKHFTWSNTAKNTIDIYNSLK